MFEIHQDGKLLHNYKFATKEAAEAHKARLRKKLEMSARQNNGFYAERAKRDLMRFDSWIKVVPA